MVVRVLANFALLSIEFVVISESSVFSHTVHRDSQRHNLEKHVMISLSSQPLKAGQAFSVQSTLTLDKRIRA